MLPVRIWRYGRDEELPARSILRAGPLVLWREEADIVSVTLGDREVVRRIYAAVRDRNWGTVKPVLTNLHEQIGKDTFRITFDVDAVEEPVHFSWKGLMTGERDGTVTFTLDGTARTTFLKNRIGFCVLHPDTCAGVRCRIVHAGAAPEEAKFPARISPHQPFLDIRSMSHEVFPDIWVEVSFEGEVFETEDQRNWTDASFKTYCTPLSIPFPVEIKAGTRVFQSVTVRLHKQPGANVPAAPRRSSRAPKGVRYEIDWSDSGKPMPFRGLGAASHGRELSPDQISLLRVLRPDHLRVDLDLSQPDCEEVLRRGQREAAGLGAQLELALFLSDDAAGELARLGAHLRKTPCDIARWLIFHRREPCTSEKWVALARQALVPTAPGIPFASGTNAYFTELNRGSPPGPSTDALVYSINPQIHAFDNNSLMETLSAHASTVESARAIGGGKPIFVSPVTLKPRFNVVATGPIAPVPPGELPPQVDARQTSLFAAAWTLGCAAGLAASGAAGVTFFETTGWRGVLEEDSGPPVPERFPSLPGCVFPLYHVLADIAELGDGYLIAGHCEMPSMLCGLSMRRGSVLRTILANLTPAPVSVRAMTESRGARVRFLDETTAEKACRSPLDFRSGPGTSVTMRAGGLDLELLPYAAARIDWEA